MRRSFLVIAIIISLGACATEQELRINNLRNQMLSDTTIPASIRTAIMSRKIMVGMTKDQVVASWGSPCVLCYGTRRSSNGDVWEYNYFGPTSLGIGGGTYLYFNNNGVLQYWSGP
jgi:hypothetical protein